MFQYYLIQRKMHNSRHYKNFIRAIIFIRSINTIIKIFQLSCTHVSSNFQSLMINQLNSWTKYQSARTILVSIAIRTIRVILQQVGQHRDDINLCRDFDNLYVDKDTAWVQLSSKLINVKILLFYYREDFILHNDVRIFLWQLSECGCHDAKDNEELKQVSTHLLIMETLKITCMSSIYLISQVFQEYADQRKINFSNLELK